MSGGGYGIALLGTGTVGGGVIEMLRDNAGLIERRCGKRLRIVSACARNLDRARAKLDGDVLLTSDWREAVGADDVDAVVELIGGTDAANDIAGASIAQGKPLVTANKALLATHGETLLAEARAGSVPILFEAAVAGCIPAIRVLRDSLAGDRIDSVLGIVNGTCNYILTRMRTGMEFSEALAEASELGYAEADPSLDIDGWDAAHKTAIIAWLAFGAPLGLEGMPVGGVRSAEPADESYARLFGYTIKQIAAARRRPEGIESRVGMALVGSDSKLAGVDDNLNAVLIDADAAGEMLLVGAGAGAMPTASAVVSDIIEAASGAAEAPPGNGAGDILPGGEASCEAYLRVRCPDTQGVVAKISAALADAGISIEAMHQNESRSGELTDIAMLLHEAKWRTFEGIAAKLAGDDDVSGEPVLLPIAVPHSS